MKDMKKDMGKKDMPMKKMPMAECMMGREVMKHSPPRIGELKMGKIMSLGMSNARKAAHGGH